MKFELNREGVKELMQSDSMMSICRGYADAALNSISASDGYEVTTRVGKTRVNAELAAVTPGARASNAKHNTILKALGSVKGGGG